MSVSSITSQHSTIFSLDKILQDIPETAIEELSDIEEMYHSYKEELNLELKTTDRVWLEFHAGQCEQFGKAAKLMLYRIVNSSIECPENSVAAANAITILKVMKVSFSCLNLQGVQIPGADLSSAILDRADLSDANLENVDLSYASLNDTNMLRTNIKNTRFDLPKAFTHSYTDRKNIVSPDDRYLVSEDSYYIYFWHIPSKTCIKKIVKPVQDSFNYYPFGEKIFTPDGQFLFIYDRQHDLDIWSIDSFEHIRKLEVCNTAISYQEPPFLSLSPNGNYLIAYRTERGILGLPSKTQVKIWEIQKTRDVFLDINLKNEIIMSNEVYKICFSKKFSIFYGFTYKYNEKTVYLSIYNLNNFLKMTNINQSNSCFVDVPISLWEEDEDVFDMHFSLAFSDTSKSDEELVFIAINNSIYSVKIVKKNEQNWVPESTQVSKVRTEIDAIFNMQLLAKTHELIYVCNNAICLYSIKNNQLIGKFRLVDTHLRRLFVSFDEANIFINTSNRFSVYPVEALKNSKYISYQLDSKATCFLADMRSIISISSSSYMTAYDIETGNMLKSKPLQKMKPVVSDKTYCVISISPDTQHILSRNSNSLFMINIENEKAFLEIPERVQKFVLSSNSEYLALKEIEGMLKIYKTTPSKQCIGQFPVEHNYFGLIAISENFRKTPKIVLNYLTKTIMFNFVFRNEILEISSQKELPVKASGDLQIQFIENDSKLILAGYKNIIILDIEHNQYEEYDIQATCVGISHDVSLLVYNDRYDKLKSESHQLCLWSIIQKKPLIVQTTSLDINKLQISLDNRYIIATTESGGIYVWKIVGAVFRLLWRTSHNLQTQGLILGDNNLEKVVEKELVPKMDAMKLQSTQRLILSDNKLEKDIEEDLVTKMDAIKLQPIEEDPLIKVRAIKLQSRNKSTLWRCCQLF